MRAAAPYILLAPSVAMVALFAVVPILIIARDSVAVSNIYGTTNGGFTLDNYARLFAPVYAKTLLYSLWVAASNSVICVLVGYLVAFHISTRPARQQPVWLVLIVIPFWTDFMVRTFAWINLLGAGGPVVALIRAFGGTTTSLIPSQAAVTLSLLYAFLPVAIFPIYASLRAVDPSLREAAEDLGAGWWQTQRRVFIPLGAPGIAGAVLLTFVPALGVYVIPVLLGGGKTLLAGNIIVTLFTEFQNKPLGSALSMLVLALLLITLIGVAAIGALARRRPSAS